MLLETMKVLIHTHTHKYTGLLSTLGRAGRTSGKQRALLETFPVGEERLLMMNPIVGTQLHVCSRGLLQHRSLPHTPLLLSHPPAGRRLPAAMTWAHAEG